MKNLTRTMVAIAAIIITVPFFAQQTYVNKKWEDTNGHVGQISRTVSTVDDNKNAVVVSNKLNAQYNTDVIITKYDPDGVLLWQHTFDAMGGDDYGVQVKTTSNGHIYVASAFQSSTIYDFGLLKYSPNGDLEWVGSWDGPASGIDIPADVEVASNGDIYLVGGTQSSGTTSDYAVVKFSANGSIIWSQTYDYANLHDAATSLKIDDDFVVVTGASASTPTNWDYATLKLQGNNGQILAEERTEVLGVGLDNAVAVTMDEANNVYVTGYVEVNGEKNIQTVKINESFGLEWVKNFDGGLEDVAKAIKVDDFGNVYIAGTTQKSNGGSDYITIKYDSNGTELWKREFGSNGGELEAEAYQLDLTESGEPIITGSREKDGQKDFATIKYDTEGELKFVKEFDAGNGDDVAESVIVKDGDVLVSGTSTVDGVKQSSTVKYSMVERERPIALDPNGHEYIESQLVVRFDRSAINYAAIYDKELTAGPLADFVHSSVWSEMSAKLGHSCKDLRTYKIFIGMTPADSISISRLGEEVPVDDHWATLTIDFDTPLDDQAVIDSLNTMQPTIHFIERDHLSYAMDLPNDTYILGNQAGLVPTADYPNADINVEEAWDVAVGQPHTKVGVIDAPIYWQHEDFGDGTFSGSKVAGGHDYVIGSSIENTGVNYDSHGTSCAGIIGAIRNNDLGIAGIAGGDLDDDNNTGVSLYSMATSYSGSHANSTLASALVSAAVFSNQSDYGFALDVLNYSLGGFTYDQAIADAVRTVWKNHCVLVVSRGNGGGNDYFFPQASKDEMLLNVGASGTDGEYFRGEGINGNGWCITDGGSSYGSDMDFIAPGVTELITSLYNPLGVPPTGLCGSNNGNFPMPFGNDGSYRVFTRTSAAAPHVSGLAGLMHSHHHVDNGAPNNLVTEDVEHIIQNTATDISGGLLNYPLGPDVWNGHGRIDAGAAMNAIDYPSKYVKHFDFNDGGSLSAESNVTCLLDEPWYGPGTYLAAAVYVGNKYKVTWDIEVVLPDDELIIDWWPRMVKNRGLGQGTFIEPSNEVLYVENFNVTDHVLTATLSTYAWHIHTTSGGQNVNAWIPTHPSYLDMGISIHIDDLLVSSIHEEANSEISLYPNPSNDQLNIQFDRPDLGLKSVTAFDLSGRKVLEVNPSKQLKENNVLSFDISHLSTGTYIIQVITDTYVMGTSFIKQ